MAVVIFDTCLFLLAEEKNRIKIFSKEIKIPKIKL